MNSTGPSAASTNAPTALADALRTAGRCLSDFPSEAEARARLAAPDALMRYRPHRLAAVLHAPPPLGAVLVKAYRPKNPLDALLERIFGHRGERSWRMGRALFEAGVPTPEPVARVRDGSAILLATRLLEEHELLTAHLKRRWIQERAAGTRAEKRLLLERVALLVARLHGAGFAHGDLTASNIVLDNRGELYLIDLDRTRRVRGPWAPAYWIADLRLLFLTSWAEVTRPEWLRLLAHYGMARQMTRSGLRRYARFVVGARRGRIRLGAAGDVEGGRVPYAKGP